MPDTMVEVPTDGEPVAHYVEVRDVPLNATAFTKLKIVGRARQRPDPVLPQRQGVETDGERV